LGRCGICSLVFNRRIIRCLGQVVEVERGRSVAQDVLAEAPVGLCTIAKDGRVLATNDVLLRWLGGVDIDPPTTLAGFIVDPSALLDSPAEPGRTVRADTRLITRKGVVTPTVMVANWHVLNSGDIVASVALYGHSTIGRDDAAGAAALGSDFDSEGYSAAPVAILRLEGMKLSDAVIRSANPAFAKMSGRDDVVGTRAKLWKTNLCRARKCKRLVSWRRAWPMISTIC